MSKGNRIRTNKAKTAIGNTAVLAANIGMSIGLTPFQSFFEIAEMANAGQATITLTAMKPIIEKTIDEISYTGITDLSIAVNHKVWQHHESNPKLAAIYQEIWEMVDSHALSHLKGKELNFYVHATN